MNGGLLTAAAFLRRRAEDVAVALLVVMFVAFLCQIVFRYVFGWPTGWAFELSIVCWVWLVLWGAAFVVTERDEIRFDIVHSLFPPGIRRGAAVLTGLTVIFLYGVSLPAVADYVSFMKVEKTAYLGIRFNLLYAVYVLFAVAVVARYIWLVWRALKGDVPVTLVDSERPEAGKS